MRPLPARQVADSYARAALAQMIAKSRRQVADCYARGSFAREIAEARDWGADSQNLLKLTAASKALPSSARESYAALITLVYRSKAVGADELASAVLIDCVRANEKGALCNQK
jgi:hypothetical protein